MLRTAARVGRRLGAFLLLALAGLASAQVCREELVGALLDPALDRPATGVDAALLMRRAVELVEPALPSLSSFRELPVGVDHPAYGAVRYLRERELLPPSWQEQELGVEAWREMHRLFMGWYELTGPLPDAPATVADLVEDVSRTLERVGRAVRPAALLATDPGGGGRLSFWAVIWNWTVYPRLLVFRPEGVPPSGAPRDALPHLSNCAVRVSAYVTAPEQTAKELFLAHNDARMYVVAAHPDGGAWPLEVEPGRELEAFAFELPELDGTNVYAAVFDGPSVGFGQLLSLMTRVRTNLSPTSFFSYMQTPR